MIRLEGCAKNYPGTNALSAIDLTIAKGEFVTLLGPSGSGKTTLLNLVAGMIKPTSGRVFINGRDVTDTPPNRRGLGVVFQNYALMPHMTIFENIAFPLRVRKVPRSDIARRVAEVLDLVRLPHVADRKPQQLSGGQQQRVALARCIVYRPDIILMDEPLGALDKNLRADMELEIRRIHSELGITILYVTHDQEEALTLSDRIVLLNAGRIEQADSPAALYHRPCSTFVANFVGHSNLVVGSIEALGPPVRIRHESGLVIISEQPVNAEVGQPVRALVRPENVVIWSAMKQGDSMDNMTNGTITDSVILGSFVRHHIDTAEGNEFVSLELNRPGLCPLERGSAVSLGWRAADVRVLLDSSQPVDSVRKS